MASVTFDLLEPRLHACHPVPPGHSLHAGLFSNGAVMRWYPVLRSDYWNKCGRACLIKDQAVYLRTTMTAVQHNLYSLHNMYSFDASPFQVWTFPLIRHGWAQCLESAPGQWKHVLPYAMLACLQTSMCWSSLGHRSSLDIHLSCSVYICVRECFMDACVFICVNERGLLIGTISRNQSRNTVNLFTVHSLLPGKGFCGKGMSKHETLFAGTLYLRPGN